MRSSRIFGWTLIHDTCGALIGSHICSSFTVSVSPKLVDCKHKQEDGQELHKKMDKYMRRDLLDCIRIFLENV